jgi:hypothetical protein
MDEKWLPVVGHEGFYEVSDHGRVRTIERQVNYKNIKTRTIPGRIRSTNALLKGYPAVNLSCGNKTKMRTVHVMVLEAFVGPRPSAAHEVCHGDGNPRNNFLSNLRWGTKLENMADRSKHDKTIHGERSSSAKLTAEIVRRIRQDERGSRPVAAELGVAASTVKRIRNRQIWAHVE